MDEIVSTEELHEMTEAVAGIFYQYCCKNSRCA